MEPLALIVAAVLAVAAAAGHAPHRKPVPRVGVPRGERPLDVDRSPDVTPAEPGQVSKK